MSVDVYDISVIIERKSYVVMRSDRYFVFCRNLIN